MFACPRVHRRICRYIYRRVGSDDARKCSRILCKSNRWNE